MHCLLCTVHLLLDFLLLTSGQQLQLYLGVGGGVVFDAADAGEDDAFFGFQVFGAFFFFIDVLGAAVHARGAGGAGARVARKWDFYARGSGFINKIAVSAALEAASGVAACVFYLDVCHVFLEKNTACTITKLGQKNQAFSNAGSQAAMWW